MKCPVDGCGGEMIHGYAMCRVHWARVPALEQRAIVRAYHVLRERGDGARYRQLVADAVADVTALEAAR